MSTKKLGKFKSLPDLIEKTANEFNAEYGGLINKTIPSLEAFSPFGENIDRIFGIRSTQIKPEHQQLIELIKKTEDEHVPDDVATNLIIEFFKSLPDYKRSIIIENINKILISVAKNPQSVGMLFSPQQIDITQELGEFNQLLEQAKSVQMTEDDLIVTLVNFFDKVPSIKRHSLLQKTGNIIKVLQPSKQVSKDNKKKFFELVKLT